VFLLARHHADETTEAKLGSNVSALASDAPSRVKKLSMEAVVLDQIARHHRIGHGSGEQLLDE